MHLGGQRKVRSLPRTKAGSRRRGSMQSGDDYSYSESDEGGGSSVGAGRGKGGRDSSASGHDEPAPTEFKVPKPPRSPLRSPVSEIRKHFSKGGLKREATSPVYLESNGVAVASIPSSARRVAQCVSSRLRSGNNDVASLDGNVSSPGSPHHSGSGDSPPAPAAGGRDDKKRRAAGAQRNKWTKEETEALVRGCNHHGIGQWKAIRDSEPLLARRSPGDLKDRFRTYFPDAYRKHYPNAKTHMSDRQRSKDKDGNELFTENAARRERKQFSAAEDEALRRGYAKHGTAWSSIAKDPILANRKSTDLRDRFRNAFPDLYGATGGYKSRTRKGPNDLYSFTTDSLDLSHSGLGGPAMYDPNASMYPTFSSRTKEFAMRQHLPSLDFLKTHGAEAFSYPHGFVAEGMGEASDSVSDLKGLHSSITPRPGATITPRPSNHTPRPNDTTPRPMATFNIPQWPMQPPLQGVPELHPLTNIPPHQIMDSDGNGHPGVSMPNAIDPSLQGHNFVSTAEMMPFRPHMLHKTQSSVDLGHFSHLTLGGMAGPGITGPGSVSSHSASPSPAPGAQGLAGFYSIPHDGHRPSTGESSSESASVSGGSASQSPESNMTGLPNEFLPYSKPSHNYSSPELGGANNDAAAGSFYQGSIAGSGIFNVPPDGLGAGLTSAAQAHGAQFVANSLGGINAGIVGMMPPGAEWNPDFETASRTFPSAFDTQDGFNFTGMMGALTNDPLAPPGVGGYGMGGLGNLAEAGSSVSSFHSSLSNRSVESLDSSSQSDHDHVLYTAADQPHLFGMSANANSTGASPATTSGSPFSPVARTNSALSHGKGAGAGDALFPGASPSAEGGTPMFGMAFKEPE